MLNQVATNILATINYYDVLDYPLTSFEIWKYLLKYQKLIRQPVDKDQKSIETDGSYSLFEIIKTLEEDGIKKYIEQLHGFYFLKGRGELVDQRIERNKISERKYKIFRRVVFWLRLVPYVRMIAVTGRMAMKNAEPKSDLDLFVAIKGGKIFTGRTLVTLLVHFMRRRRYSHKITDRICLNYFISDSELEISVKDLFASSEYFFMLPLFGQETFRRFQKENIWIKDYHPNFTENEMDNLKMLEDNFFTKNIRRVGEFIFQASFIESNLKKWQVQRIERDPRTHLEGSLVMADDNALVFLPSPQGPKVFEKFREKLEEQKRTFFNS
jgi:predicted nucleotidyltransferase